MSLVIAACRDLCDWRPSRATRGDRRLFACTGCGSQWTRRELWAPRQADGSVPAGVREELSRHEDEQGAGAPGTAGS